MSKAVRWRDEFDFSVSVTCVHRAARGWFTFQQENMADGGGVGALGNLTQLLLIFEQNTTFTVFSFLFTFLSVFTFFSVSRVGFNGPAGLYKNTVTVIKVRKWQWSSQNPQWRWGGFSSSSSRPGLPDGNSPASLPPHPHGSSSPGRQERKQRCYGNCKGETPRCRSRRHRDHDIFIYHVNILIL